MSLSSLARESGPRIVTDLHYASYSNHPNGSGQSYHSPTDLTQPNDTFVEEDELVTAMHDFVPDMPAATCLTFNTGQVIRVLNKDATGWWDGELVEPYPISCTVTRGWFPSNYVSQPIIHRRQPSASTSVQQLVTDAVHQRNISHSSVASVQSLQPSRGPRATTASAAPTLTSIPQILHPLLHSLSVLHGAAQHAKYQHYQPSAALIISGVRKILTEAKCISKDSPTLRNHPELSEARAVLLNELADLVQHAKRAAAVSQDRREENEWEDVGNREDEALEGMLRMAGQVFTATRRFVKRLEECDVQIPEWEGAGVSRVTVVRSTRSISSSASSSSGTHSRSTSGASAESDDHQRLRSNSSASESSSVSPLPLKHRRDQWLDSPNGTPQQRGVAIGSPSQDDITVRGRGAGAARSALYSSSSRARSMTDLRKHRYRTGANNTSSASGDSVVAPLHKSNTRSHSRYPAQKSIDSLGSSCAPLLPKSESLTMSNTLKHKKVYSGASMSSTSSWSSYATPPTPDFPTGICSAEQVLGHLRTTQDTLLSSIAAFIGHIYNHSRLAHSTSKGHIINYGIEIVEKVKTMLALVDNIVKQPEIVKSVAFNKRSNLSEAKHNLFLVTNELVAYVRVMTVAYNRDISDAEEEAEKSKTLNAATGVHRAAQDCTKCANVVLTRASGEPSFVIHLPDNNEQSVTPLDRKSGLGPLQEYETADETLVGESAPETVTETEQEPEVESEAERSQGQDQEQEQEQEQEPAQDDTLKAEGLGPVLPPEPASSSISLENSPAPPLADELEYGGHDDSIVSFASEEGSTEHGDEAEEDDEEVESITPAGDQDVNCIIVHPPDGNAIQSDVQSLEGSAAGHVASLEEKILYGTLPSVPLSASSTSSTFPSSSESGEGEREHRPQLSIPGRSVPDVVYNNDGLVVGATLRALVEKMTSADALAEASFSSVFFLTFRFFATPDEIMDELIARFYTVPAEVQGQQALDSWQKTKGFAIKVRVLNIMKTWLEAYWRPEKDDSVLKRMLPFAATDQTHEHPGLAALAGRLQDLVRTRLLAMDSPGHIKAPSNRGKTAERLRELGNSVSPVSPSEIPRPQITKSLFNMLRNGDFVNVVVTDFDSLELARQLTVLESRLYRAVLPDEVLDVGRSGSCTPANVKAITSLSTAIAGWVTESILGEQDTKKRASLLKFFIKIADRCSKLNNFATPRSILAALDSATISRLQQTWAAIPQKQRLQFDALRKLADYSRNFAEYRSRLRNTVAPAVPFLGLYLTDLTFCRDGNPSHRPHPSAPERQLINFNKYYKLARIVQDMQRFQTPYTLKEISEVQQYLAFVLKNTKSEGDLQDLYRRSLVVEPRQPTEEKAGEIRFFGWATRSSSNSPSVQQAPQPIHT